MSSKPQDLTFIFLPFLWANFNDLTDLSCTSMTLDQPTILDDLNMVLNQAGPAAQVEAG